MTRSLGFLIAGIVVLGSGVSDSMAAKPPPAEPQQLAADTFDDEGLVGPPANVTVSKALQDTVWIADWTFDAPGGGCTDAGWVKWDNRILNVNNDAEFWHVDNRLSGIGGMSGKAAILSKHDLCWAADGYGNDNDFSVILKYSGSNATLNFDVFTDTEVGFDPVTVEGDSAGASEALGDPSVSPAHGPSFYRDELLLIDEPTSVHVALSLPNYGPGTHEVYIRLNSDRTFSHEDCFDFCVPGFHAGLAVDNVVMTGGLPYSENFEGALNPNVTLVETANALPYRDAPWLRVFPHLADTDPCTENTTCAWVGTDPSLPGPGEVGSEVGSLVRPWLDDIVASPWVSLATTLGASATTLRFRRFGGQPTTSTIVQSWRVRTKVRTDNTDTPAPGDSIDCISPWGHAHIFDPLSSSAWVTSTFDMTPWFDGDGTDVQVSFRTVDWRLVSPGGMDPVQTGAGPLWDRVRIGRRVATTAALSEGIDSRSQAQDAFPTVVDPSIVGGEHFVPDGANRFGTCAFSQGSDLGINTTSTRLVTGDSIWINAVPPPGVDVTSVRVYGAIVAGPHTGKVPGPYASVGGFLEVNAENSRLRNGTIVANRWFVDLDDTYFRGGDVLVYFWAVTDAGGGFSSLPGGLTALPASVAQAEAATGGLHEVSYLPKINWDPNYVAAVVAHPTGDVDPTPEQIANSAQANCILYYQKTNSRRRSGAANRTSFMYTLDNLGYRGNYDVYDVQGYGNTANQLAGRANVAQASGYSLVIQDDGRSNLTPNIPNGENNDANQLQQANWYRAYLAQGAAGIAGSATFWSIGENTGFLHAASPLFSTDFGLSGVVNDQALSVNPRVRGKTMNMWASGAVTDFTGDEFALNGGCPTVRTYDGANGGAGATVTHRYAVGATEGAGAVVMNRNATLKWNTVWMGFAWFDMRYQGPPVMPGPERILASKIIGGTVPVGCLRIDETGVPEDDDIDAPVVSSLHPNVPNPFNPTTKIAFDLATGGRVQLRIYDVAGKLVRTLVDETRPPGRYTETWTGLNTAGARMASGVYFYRLDAAGFEATRKMVLLQ